MAVQEAEDDEDVAEESAEIENMVIDLHCSKWFTFRSKGINE